MQMPFKIAGLLLITTGISHVSQLWFFPPSTMLNVAAGAGVIYALLGMLILFGGLHRIALPAAILCGLGFMTGSYRLFFVEFSLYGLVHQLMHVVIISCCITSVVTVSKPQTSFLHSDSSQGS